MLYSKTMLIFNKSLNYYIILLVYLTTILKQFR